MRDPFAPQGVYISLRVISLINSHYVEDEMNVPGVTDVDWVELQRRYEAGEVSEAEVNEIAERALRAIGQILREAGVEAMRGSTQTRQERMEEIERRRETVLAECSDKVPTYKPR
jgi:hypothetical protein